MTGSSGWHRAGWPGAGRNRAGRPDTGPTAGLVAPRITVDVGARVAGPVVRLLPAVLVAVVGELVGAGPLAGAVLAVLAVTLLVRPAFPAVAGVVLVAGLALLTGPDLLAPPGMAGGASLGGGGGGGPGGVGPAGPLRLGLTVLVLDATVRTAALAPHVAWTAWVERSVLAGVGRAVLRTQVLVQPVAWLAYAVRATTPGAGDREVLRLVALVAVAVLLGLLVPRRRRPGEPP